VSARREETTVHETTAQEATAMTPGADRPCTAPSAHTFEERLERERHRIARALHDEVAQLLAVVQLALEDVRGEVSAAARPRFAEAIERIDEAGGRVRRIAHELRPSMLDDLGLVPALEFLAAGIGGRGGLEVAVESSAGGRLPRAAETALYRIAQEALSNVVRHARARRAEIRLETPDRAVSLTVRDDGDGFDVERARRPGTPSLGLSGIEERVRALGGSFEIRSAPGAGTELRVGVPLTVRLGSSASVPGDGRTGGPGGGDPSAARR
jgi:signal transduction histidine kinase